MLNIQQHFQIPIDLFFDLPESALNDALLFVSLGLIQLPSFVDHLFHDPQDFRANARLDQNFIK
ncbi:MAG: hypothetical protein GYB36_12825 [Alphaproteobacteria bacterium]|nr:hypothetical protein [Alphaproteobacteria bacterium]